MTAGAAIPGGPHRGAPERDGRPEGRWAHTYAALDLGTNNCRLLVARPTRHGFRVIDSFSRIVRLGQGVASSGRLAEPAMERALSALKVCAGKMNRRQVTVSRSVATEACRKAVNGREFLERVLAETGLNLDIIEPAEEARLAAVGCTPLMDRDCSHALVFDIGGGSTEVMWLRLCADLSQPELLAWTSVPWGVVTLAEAYGGRDISPEIYEAMITRIQTELWPFEDAQGLRKEMAGGKAQMLGTSGTVTTLAALKLDLPRYDRSRVDGVYLEADDLADVSKRLSAMTYDERTLHPCIGRGRADLVVAGCAIFDAIFRIWPSPRIRVADRGVRDGMLFHLMDQADAGLFTTAS